MNDRIAGGVNWHAVYCGATCYPLNIREDGLDGLANLLIQEKITVLNLYVTAFRHFVDTLTGAEKFPNLRLIRLGAEPVYKRDVELYRRHFSPDCLLANLLGTTETGLICEYFVNRETQIDGSLVPVGYPVPDKQVLLLDEHGKEIEPDQVGEIAVKSRYLSDGYWRKPELTQAKFLPDSKGGDERIYLTGDLGCMLPDGRFIHMGRRDFQVQIRGYRVEVAEIEMALVNLDAIKEAVVVAREDSRDDQRLVAYLVPVEGLSFTVSTLRRALAEVLPDYMIPSAFVTMDALPLTSSGKVNRLALPEPGTARPELGIPFAAPRTPVEDTLARIWSDVLGLDEVGIYDDFFALGGNSLLATQIISRVINTFQVRVPLIALFQSPTIADMALAIVQNMTEEAESEDIEQMLAELAELSEDEVKMRLDDEIS
jgi:acyl-coenzyme A synthetase/AMP-(fatty) acid ligase